MINGGTEYRRVVDIVLRMAVVVAIFAFSVMIISPFVTIIIWSTIIAISLSDVHIWFTKKLKGRNKLSAILLVTVLMIVIILPFIFLANALLDNVRNLQEYYEGGNFSLKTPDDRVKEIPVVGNKLYDLWYTATHDTKAIVEKNSERITKMATAGFAFLGAAGRGILMFIGSVIVAGVVLIYNTERKSLGHRVGRRLAGEKGEEFSKIAENTIRNVVTGVIGVAVIQATLAGFGFFIAGVPLAGIWTLLCLILAIVQIGVGPIMIVAAIYLFATDTLTTAIIFGVWTVIVTISDNALKPFLYGRGSTTPMLVIFLGAVGGLIYNGIIGLFIGPVFLAFAYELFKFWITEDDEKPIQTLDDVVAEEAPHMPDDATT